MYYGTYVDTEEFLGLDGQPVPLGPDKLYIDITTSRDYIYIDDELIPKTIFAGDIVDLVFPVTSVNGQTGDVVLAVGDVVGLNDALSLKADKIGTDAISVRQNIITPNTSIQLLPSADIYIRSQSGTASRLYNSTPGTLTLSTTFAGNTGTLTLNSNGNVSIPNGHVFQPLLPIQPSHLWIVTGSRVI